VQDRALDQLAAILLSLKSGASVERGSSRHGSGPGMNGKSLPKTYRALVAKKVGNSFAEVATVVEKPMPDVKAGEALVRVEFAGVNGGCETFRARGEHAFKSNRESRDFALGAEGVGIVAAVGEGVTNVAVGDAVCFVGAAFAEYSSVSAAFLWKIPNASAEYVGLRISALTACAMLEQTGKLRKGETVLITAAAGGAGHFAVQFAKLAGCTVIGTCSSKEKAAALCKLGCDFIINHKTQNVREKLKKIAPDGLDAILEGVGGEMLQISLDHLSPNGRLLQIGYISEYPHNKDSQKEADAHAEDTASLFWKAETIHRGNQTIFGNAWPKDPSCMGACKDRVLSLHDEGRLTSLVDEAREFNGLDEVSAAVDYMLSGIATGKVVVKI